MHRQRAAHLGSVDAGKRFRRLLGQHAVREYARCMPHAGDRSKPVAHEALRVHVVRRVGPLQECDHIGRRRRLPF